MRKVEEVIDSKIKEFLNSKYFEGLVERMVIIIIKQGVDDGFYGRTSFEKFITREVSRKLDEMVFKKYEVKVEEKEK